MTNKRRVNLYLNAVAVENAKKEKINISALAEIAIGNAIKEKYGIDKKDNVLGFYESKAGVERVGKTVCWRYLVRAFDIVPVNLKSESVTIECLDNEEYKLAIEAGKKLKDVNDYYSGKISGMIELVANIKKIIREKEAKSDG